jgi:hypothetical protein
MLALALVCLVIWVLSVANNLVVNIRKNMPLPLVFMIFLFQACVMWCLIILVLIL